MLDKALADQFASHLTKLQHPVELVATVNDSAKSTEMTQLLTQIAGLHEKVTVRTDGTNQRTPSFDICRKDTDIAVRFAGIPLGHEFTSLVLAILHVGGHPPQVDEADLETVRGLTGTMHFETYYSLSCQNCPDVVQALNIMAVNNPNISHTAIDGALYPNEVKDRDVLAVPAVYLNGEPLAQGRMTLTDIIGKLDTDADANAVDRINGLDPFDVLIVGGGPAGATAALYAARKGIRTGVVAGTFGGQTMDTMGIENYPSVAYTEGPRFATDLRSQLKSLDVEVITGQQAASLTPADTLGGHHTLTCESGANVTAKTVVVATGARWRTLNVPGEDDYRNKGVTFCPHCDGPLFAGQDIAVVGGGNSGVEAAIDLAGIAKHVTVVEFMDSLKADDVLQRKLHSLPNVTVLTSHATTKIVGDGSKVTGMAVNNRTTGEDRELPVAGVFVQIGLLPNTEWLTDTVDLSPHAEVVVDEHCGTNIPGVFAAGDCTTVPYKQIVISAGQGAVASLACFDHLIRTSAPTA